MSLSEGIYMGIFFILFCFQEIIALRLELARPIFWTQNTVPGLFST